MNTPGKSVGSRTSVLMLALCWFLFACGSILAQPNPGGASGGKRSLGSVLSETLFLREAKELSDRASHYKSGGQHFQAIRLYEELIAKNAQLPADPAHSYEYHLLVAGAHLDAADMRIKYATTLGSNLAVREQNQALILDHLERVPALAVAAAKTVNARGTEGDRLRCPTYKLLASGLFFRGTFTENPQDLLKSVEAYEHVAACDKHSNATEMKSYAKGVEAELSKRMFRRDNIAKITSKIVGLAVPKAGGYLSMAIDFLYEHHKETKQKNMPVPPR